MVRRLLEFFHRDVVGVHRVAYLLAFSALASQLLALVRDRLLASEFGASLSLDVYYAAFKVQDILFFTFASVLSLSVVIPILLERVEEKKALRFLNSIFSVFCIGIIFSGALLFILAPIILPFIFPGLWGKGMNEELILVTRILLLSPMLLGLSNLLSSVSQVFQKFYLYSISPVLYNVGIIIGIIYFYPIFGISGLAWGVILGALLHLIIKIPFTAEVGLLPRITLKIDWLDVREVIALSLPRTLTLFLNYLVLLIFTGVASLMAEGSITVLNFSFNIQSVPLALIGASYSVAAFPILAKHFGVGEMKEFIENITAAARHIIFWSFPVIALFIVLRAHITRVILGGGVFDWSDTRLIAASLALFVISIVAQSLSLLFIRGFYAMGDTKKPLIIVSFSAVVTVLLAFIGNYLFNNFPGFLYFFEYLLRVDGEVGTSVLLLPLAFSVGSIIQTILLYWVMRNSIGSLHLGRSLFEGFCGAIVAGFVTYKSASLLGEVYLLESLPMVFIVGVISGFVGMIFGVIALYLLKSRELFEIVLSLRTRFKRKDVIISGE